MEKAIMEKNGLELSGARQVAPVYFNLFFSIILSVTVPGMGCKWWSLLVTYDMSFLLLWL